MAGNITISQVILYSVLGISVVFLTLISLALIIIGTSKLLKALGLSEENMEKQVAATKAPTPSTSSVVDENAELIAAIIGAVTEEAGEGSIVTSIIEVK